MDGNQYVDMGGYGFDIKASNDEYCEYLKNDNQDRIYMRIYGLMTGVELYFCDIHTCESLRGEMNEIAFYQIAYCHSGIYKSKVEKHRGINLHSGEVFLCKNIYSGISSSMPLGYYEGVSLMVYTKMLGEESKTILNYFGIEIEELFERLLDHKKLCRFICENKELELFESLFHAAKKNNLQKMRKLFIDILVSLNASETSLSFDYCNINVSTADKINDIRQYIEDHFQTHLSIEELAQKFSISTTSLKQNFKKLYGHSPYEVLKRYRMEIAAFKLRLSTEAIGKIATEVGYENPSKFSAAFYSIYGVSPKDYRKMVQREQLI